MSEDQGERRPDLAQPVAAGGDGSAPERLVVIQYRGRALPSRLLPPLLVLMAASAVVYFRIQAVHWPGLLARLEQSVAAPLPPPVPATAPRDEPLKVVLVTQPPAVREAAKPPEMKPAPKHATAEPEAAEGDDSSDTPASKKAPKPPLTAVGFDPPQRGAKPPIASKDPKPASERTLAPEEPKNENITVEQFWADVRRQAAQTDAQQKQAAQMAPVWLEQDRRDVIKRQAERVAEAVHKANVDRPHFRADLQRILTRWRDQAAPEIEKLCQRYGREAPQEIEDATQEAFGRSAGRFRRNDRINLVRQAGMPEARILDYLNQQELKNILARNGPRNHDDALVRAARKLLAIPLPPPQPGPRPETRLPTATIAPLPPTPAGQPTVPQRRIP